MILKTTFILRILPTVVCIIGLTSCESHEQKADDPFEKIKEEKQVIKDSIVINKEMPKATKVVEVTKKIENADDWSKFKTDLEKKIFSNETTIKTLKEKPEASSKTLRKVGNLEKENNNLRNQLEQYTEDAKVRLETFKTQTNHDVNQIEIELNDITITTKSKAKN
jgi:hypothetical protein